MTVDWSERGAYIGKHGVSVAEANEALRDLERVVLDPDPKSKSGRGVRTIGYSASADAVLTVITVAVGDVVHGSNAWNANSTDRRIYREEQS